MPLNSVGTSLGPQLVALHVDHTRTRRTHCRDSSISHGRPVGRPPAPAYHDISGRELVDLDPSSDFNCIDSCRLAETNNNSHGPVTSRNNRTSKQAGPLPPFLRLFLSFSLSFVSCFRTRGTEDGRDESYQFYGIYTVLKGGKYSLFFLLKCKKQTKIDLHPRRLPVRAISFHVIPIGSAVISLSFGRYAAVSSEWIALVFVQHIDKNIEIDP